MSIRLSPPSVSPLLSSVGVQGQAMNDPLRAAIEVYLGQYGATLFGQAYDLSEEGRLDAAVEFVAETVRGVLRTQWDQASKSPTRMQERYWFP